jgi:hypothetical protein
VAHWPTAASSHVAFWQNWYIGSQSAFDVHDPNAGPSPLALPASRGAPEVPVEQLATSTSGLAHVWLGAGKLAALHVVTGEPPAPHVCSPAPHAQSPPGNMQQRPSVAIVVDAPG